MSRGASARERGRIWLLQVLASEEQKDQAAAAEASQLNKKSRGPLLPLSTLSCAPYPSAVGGFSVMALSWEEGKSRGSNRKREKRRRFSSLLLCPVFNRFFVSLRKCTPLTFFVARRTSGEKRGREKERGGFSFSFFSSSPKKHDAPLHPAPGGRARRRHGRAEV